MKIVVLTIEKKLWKKLKFKAKNKGRKTKHYVYQTCISWLEEITQNIDI